MKFTIPLLIAIVVSLGLIYRKFFWCNVLLPINGDPYGAGDLLELLPLLVLAILCFIGSILGLLLLIQPQKRNVTFGVGLLLISITAIPIYLAAHSSLTPVCNDKK